MTRQTNNNNQRIITNKRRHKQTNKQKNKQREKETITIQTKEIKKGENEYNIYRNIKKRKILIVVRVASS